MKTIQTHKSWLLGLLCLTIFSLPLITVKGAFDAFAYFPGSDVKGETLDKEASGFGAFEILAFEIGAENNIDIGSISAGGTAGRATFKELTLTKIVDTTSAAMFSKLTAGDHFEDMTIYLRKSGSDVGDGVTFLKYEFKLVMIQDISWTGSSGDDIVEETVVMQYGAMKVTYTEQDQQGKAYKDFDAEWSRVLNEATLEVN